ncbi:efflux pump, RND family, outer membrane protein [Geotalea daltonii FRC-32]|uniref:Efflux pump, RND family, outer membrane protein n=1 Tax=Geotalea daltonii (strain DSM 22248 / JCM 15807 / FRC-32) TaxID=316067 RepID=B9LZN1_GEODF|nr:TolC family protein [Geotalea daltonii]ACM18845.1 efflux pump, RND family, outer membrane protein [Geotalea daltonii FRC-32]
MQIIYFALCLLLSFPMMCFAEPKISPRQAILIALEKNHQLQATAHEVTAAEEDVNINRSRYLPRVSFEESAAVSNSPTRVFMMKLDQGKFASSDFDTANLNKPDSYHDFKTALTLEQPLFDLSLLKSTSIAKTAVESQKFAADQKRQDVAVQVYSAWLAVRRAKAYVSIAEQAMAEAKEHLRLAGARVGVGTGLKSEGLRAKTFLFDVEQQLVTASNDLKLAKMQLAMVIGGTPGEEVDIVDDLSVVEMTSTMKELQLLAVENRKDLQAVNKETQKAATAIELARAAYLPTLYASASYQLNDYSVPFGRDNDSWQAGVTLRWEFFSGLKTRNEVNKFKSLERAAQEYQKDYANSIAYQVSENVLRHGEAGKRLELARQAVIDAEESVRLISKRFQNSLSPMVELLDAQTSLNRARAVQVEMENGQALALARIWQSAGIFLKEVLK